MIKHQKLKLAVEDLETGRRRLIVHEIFNIEVTISFLRFQVRLRLLEYDYSG